MKKTLIAIAVATAAVSGPAWGQAYPAKVVRIKSAPELPTVAESGYKDFAVILWHGSIGPKNLPRNVVDRVNGELNKALKTKDMEEKLLADGVEPKGGSSEDFLAVIKADLQRWVPTARRLGIKPS
jgi:tripartite-type tricarboxylate transporter receptor subunit TctC